MLVLARKSQEQILLPDLGIRITVLNIGTGRVQLGIEAPRSIQVTRPDVRHRPGCTTDSSRLAMTHKPR